MVGKYKTTRIEMKSAVTQIMIVEDNDINFRQLDRSIKGTYPDAIIDRAINENEAIRLLEDNVSKREIFHYNFIIADIKLDEGGGSQFGGIHLLEYVVENNIDFIKDKFIVITAHQGMTYLEQFGRKISVADKARELGAYDCISRIGENNYLEEVTNKITHFPRSQDISHDSYDSSKIDADRHDDTKSSNNIDKKHALNLATHKIQNFLKQLEETTFAFIEAIEEEGIAEIPLSSNLEKTEHNTRIEFPSESILKSPIQLIIQIPQQSHTVENKLQPAILDIHLTAENFDLEQKRQRLIVAVDEKPKEIIFELTPNKLGEQIVEIEFFHKCSRVGYVIAKTDVKSQAT